jgi:hypothetical protein
VIADVNLRVRQRRSDVAPGPDDRHFLVAAADRS